MKVYHLPLLFFLVLLAAFTRIPDSPVSGQPQGWIDTTGKKIYTLNCMPCHKDTAGGKAPGLFILRSMTPHALYATLKSGKMRVQGSALSEEQKKALAEWITGYPMKPITLSDTIFTKFSLARNDHRYDHWGWGNDYEGTGFRNASQTTITKENVGELKLKWAFGFPEATIVRSKPAVYGDWLILGSQFGTVVALNKNTGKIGWTFSAGGAIRGAVSIIKNANGATVIFADYLTNVYALNVANGKLKWSQRAGFDPLSSVTGSVVAYNGKIYVPISTTEIGAVGDKNLICCTTAGGVVALNANTGKIVWTHRNTAKAKMIGKNKKGQPYSGPSGAPVWCSPTIDVKRKRLYIGTGQNYTYPTTDNSDALQALDLETGKTIWTFQATANDAYNTACPMLLNCPDNPGPDLDFGMAPIIVKQKDGTEILVAGQKSGVVFGISPVSGKMVWKTRVGKGGALGGIHWGMASDGEKVYAANSDNIVALDARDTSVKPSSGIFALNPKTGEMVWKALAPPCPNNGFCFPFNSAAPLAIPGVVFAGSTNGHIRAYDSDNGNILWDYETAHEYQTVDGVKGKGGSIDGPAPVIAGGMLFVNSGYGMFGQTGGNVLLAFELPKR